MSPNKNKSCMPSVKDSPQKTMSKSNEVFLVKKFASEGHRWRIFEDVALILYVLLALLIIPCTDSSSGYLSGNCWRVIGQVIAVACVAVVLVLGMRWADRFGPYWLWGWRETFAVTFLCMYAVVGWLVRPQDSVLKESGWIICILIQSIILACAQYLEAWYHGGQGLEGCIEKRTLVNQACWHIFTACWTALATAIVIAGIAISLGGAGKIEDKIEGREDFVYVIIYLIVTVVSVFLWMLRPCFQKSYRIISELSAVDVAVEG